MLLLGGIFIVLVLPWIFLTIVWAGGGVQMHNFNGAELVVMKPYHVRMKYWTYNCPRSTIYVYPSTAGPLNPKMVVPTLSSSFARSHFHLFTLSHDDLLSSVNSNGSQYVFLFYLPHLKSGLYCINTSVFSWFILS